jgi:hypothetical protein
MSEPHRGVRPGDVIRVEEPDYMYGVGPLILRVTGIGSVARVGNDAWVNLEGYQLRPDGSKFAPETRFALVRVKAVRRFTPPEPKP